MTDHQESDPLSHRIGGQSVRENLARAVADGRLVVTAGGRWTLPPDIDAPSPWLYGGPALDRACGSKVTRFLFDCAYDRGAVPFNCRDCYKVKAVPKTLRQLLALYEIAKTMGVRFKCGVELETPTVAGCYAGFFYLDGLDEAREIRQCLRERVDAVPALGPEVAILIKRGCTEFEHACGPSDRYSFAPELEALEAELLPRFTRGATRRENKPRTLSYWIATAFRIGDDTYRDLTNGRRLYPATVTYD